MRKAKVLILLTLFGLRVMALEETEDQAKTNNQACEDYLKKITQDVNPKTCKGVFGKFLQERKKTPCYNAENDFSATDLKLHFQSNIEVALGADMPDLFKPAKKYSFVPACMALTVKQCQLFGAEVGANIAAAYDRSQSPDHQNDVSPRASLAIERANNLSYGQTLRNYNFFVESLMSSEALKDPEFNHPLCPSPKFKKDVASAAFSHSSLLAKEIKNQDKFDQYVFTELNPPLPTGEADRLATEQQPLPVQSAKPVTAQGQPVPANPPPGSK